MEPFILSTIFYKQVTPMESNARFVYKLEAPVEPKLVLTP
ncbi:MAG: hypothetical protein JWQ66_4314 [Mucilaginibacter sp.]|nr:hypothetical protein [Mucilaginibacter sp.]